MRLRAHCGIMVAGLSCRFTAGGYIEYTTIFGTDSSSYGDQVHSNTYRD